MAWNNQNKSQPNLGLRPDGICNVENATILSPAGQQTEGWTWRWTRCCGSCPGCPRRPWRRRWRRTSRRLPRGCSRSPRGPIRSEFKVISPFLTVFKLNCNIPGFRISGHAELPGLLLIAPRLLGPLGDRRSLSGMMCFLSRFTACDKSTLMLLVFLNFIITRQHRIRLKNLPVYVVENQSMLRSRLPLATRFRSATKLLLSTP